MFGIGEPHCRVDDLVENGLQPFSANNRPVHTDQCAFPGPHVLQLACENSSVVGRRLHPRSLTVERRRFIAVELRTPRHLASASSRPATPGPMPRPPWNGRTPESPSHEGYRGCGPDSLRPDRNGPSPRTLDLHGRLSEPRERVVCLRICPAGLESALRSKIASTMDAELRQRMVGLRPSDLRSARSPAVSLAPRPGKRLNPGGRLLTGDGGGRSSLSGWYSAAATRHVPLPPPSPRQVGPSPAPPSRRPSSHAVAHPDQCADRCTGEASCVTPQRPDRD